MEFLFGNENAAKSIVQMAAQLCEYAKNHQIVHFKYANFMVCELHLKLLPKKNF